ncbi:MAG: D-glycero-beta-D-manno-heptose 1-phosphate adenylyltransferase [Candidatus Zixiibacteriota bacterium]
MRKRGRKLVFTNGVFDILHFGHVQYLQKAKTLGDVLIIGLNTDSSIRKFKGPNRPLNRQSDRAGVLSALECVDFIVCFSEPTPLNLIKLIKPDILVKGADYKIDDIVGANFVKSYNGAVKRIRLLSGRSTTGLIGKLKKKIVS